MNNSYNISQNKYKIFSGNSFQINDFGSIRKLNHYKYPNSLNIDMINDGNDRCSCKESILIVDDNEFNL